VIRDWFSALKRWYQRRFRGYVAAPARSGGTSWQQHPYGEMGFTCRCGQAQAFTEDHYVIRHQEHAEGCQFPTVDGKPLCSCPITDARYVKICPGCGLGHWRQA
jgi:hypothetical protein